MKKIQLTCLLIILTGSLYCQSEAFLKYTIEDYFLKSDIVTDLNSMIKSIEDVHPNPYHSCSKERIYNLKDSIISYLPDTVSKNLTYLAFKQMTAAYKEGHTDVLLFVTRSDLPKYKESFPLWIDSYNDSGFIVTANGIDSIDIKPGDIITSINGVQESLIKKKIAQYSGESETYALNEVMGFQFPLWVELLDIKSPFNIVYLRNGHPKTIKMDGIPAIRYNELYDHLSDVRKQPFEFSILENNIACIEFNNFDYLDKFEKFLKKSFKTMKKKKCVGLIIDIRNNSGGKEDLSPLLIDYIYDKPYKRINAVDTKVSQYHKNMQKTIAKMPQYKYLETDTISGYFNAPDGSIFEERDTTLVNPSKNKYRFTGKACILIGPKCFSYANAFAAEIKYNGFAEMIGEPLEVSQDEYADICLFILPETKFKFMTSTAYYYAIDKNNTAPVQPDIFVEQQLDDTKKGKDSILEFAKKWILKQ